MKYITAIDVRDYAFCPMKVYYVNVLHIHERTTEAMELGREIHDEKTLTHLIPKFKAVKILRNVELVSSKLRVMGRIDYILITKFNEYIPADMKWSEPEYGLAQKQHRMQMATYSLLIEESYKTIVKRAVIYYSRAGKTIIVPITDSLKSQVADAIDKIYRMIRSEEEPKVRISLKRCVNCNYMSYCKSRSVGKTLRFERII
ncbi:MAG: CRISPR-associated protein Cas4 [Candidatus Methanomethylicia archaeon]